MNGGKRFLGAIRLINSLCSSQLSRTHRHWHQVPPLSRLPIHFYASPISYSFVSVHMKSFCSTQADPTVELVLSTDWSKELEQELTESSLTLNHESVMYVLKKLDRHPQKASNFFDWVCEKKGFKPSSAIYGLMLRIFAKKVSMKQFWVTIKAMKDHGYYIDGETYKTIQGDFKKMKMSSDATALTHFYNRMLKENSMDELVKRVVEVIMMSDWGYEVEKKLGEMNILVSDDFVFRTLRDLQGCGSKALCFFKWVGGRHDYEHNTVTYNAVVRVLAWEESIGEFWGMLKEMKSLGHEMDLDTYIKISRRFQKKKMLKDAVELYEHMMDGPFKPSVQDCSFLLRNLAGVSNPNLDLVFRVVEKFEAGGHTMSKNVYDGVHRSLTSVGRFEEAEKILEAMRDSGYKPDNITYSQLIYGLCKVRKLEEARKVLDLMEANECVPDIKTWTILIQGHCTANAVDEALTCFADMIGKNCDADADLVDVLINGFLCQNRAVGAYKFLVEMVNTARLRPWQSTFKKLIQMLLGERRFEGALELLRIMKKQNYPPCSEPFVQYVSKFGSVDDASEFLQALSVKEYPSVPAYLHVFRAFFQEGRQSEAKDLLYMCPHHIREHKTITSLFGSASISTSVSSSPALSS